MENYETQRLPRKNNILNAFRFNCYFMHFVVSFSLYFITLTIWRQTLSLEIVKI